ncbi:hypothetical protein DFS33DRAFT_1382625 [Desarmillaria ectypa]|nr:hypothetical protein DFS33DRAFT_1382625 [Desarmillaria ectypa]
MTVTEQVVRVTLTWSLLSSILYLFSTVSALKADSVTVNAEALQSPRCTDPSIRKEWRALSSSEQADWTTAVNVSIKIELSKPRTVDRDISQIPALTNDSSLSDNFVYLHMDLNIKIHWTGYFLPWHRLLTFKFERALQDYCGYTGTQPYWNWTQDAYQFANSTMWDEDPVSGLGPITGDEDKDFSLSTDEFSNLTLAYPSEHIVQRNLILQPFLVLGNLCPDNPDDPPDYYQYVDWMFAPEYVQSMVVDNVNYTGDFKAFQHFLEGSKMTHEGTPWTASLARYLNPQYPPYLGLILKCRLPGGDSSSLCPENYTECGAGGPKWSNDDPLFYLHDAMIDKLYWEWQNKDPSNLYAFEGGSVQSISTWAEYVQYPNGAAPWLNLNSTIPGDGMWDAENITIWDVIDIQSGILCYDYE